MFTIVYDVKHHISTKMYFLVCVSEGLSLFAIFAVTSFLNGPFYTFKDLSVSFFK